MYPPIGPVQLPFVFGKGFEDNDLYLALPLVRDNGLYVALLLVKTIHICALLLEKSKI